MEISCALSVDYYFITFFINSCKLHFPLYFLLTCFLSDNSIFKAMAFILSILIALSAIFAFKWCYGRLNKYFGVK